MTEAHDCAPLTPLFATACQHPGGSINDDTWPLSVKTLSYLVFFLKRDYIQCVLDC
jgi:hypothetical protein